MYCLPYNKVLSPDDLEVDLIIAIHSVRGKMTNRWLDSDGRTHQKLWQSRENVWIGHPVVIKSINFPFVAVQQIDSSVKSIFDTRDFIFMSVTKDYAVVLGATKEIAIKNPAPLVVFDRKKRLYQHKVARRPSRYCDSKGKPHVYKVSYEE